VASDDRRGLLALLVVALVATACSSRSSALLQPATTAPATVPSTAPAPTAAVPTTVAAPPTTVAPTTTRPARHVTLAFTGDTMAHSPLVARGVRNGAEHGVDADFAPMWERIAPTIQAADLAICHLETTITTTGATPTGYPRVRAPKAFVDALAGAGYDGCSVASNHAFDYGADGVLQTIDALEQDGLGFAGVARSADEAAPARSYDVGGVRVAHLSATYGLNGFRLPADEPWLVEQIDVPRLLEQAHAARLAGADIVVVSLHCCTEYRTAPTDAQVDNAQQLLASPDVDLVVGHHAHVVQPIERLGDKYVLYGLGNILSNMYGSRCCPASTQDGVVVEVDFTEGLDGRFHTTAVTFTPTWVDRAAGFVITPVAAALRDPATPPDTRAALEASWQRTVDAIDSRGAADQGVRPSAVP
jgi:poly-gamma-glutamate synthesis protein (capsule biosynthesis protein)